MRHYRNISKPSLAISTLEWSKYLLRFIACSFQEILRFAKSKRLETLQQIPEFGPCFTLRPCFT